MHKFLLLFCLIAFSSPAQQLVLPKPEAVERSFYVEQVIDGRKDTLSNGNVTISGKKTAAQFLNGAAQQFFLFASTKLTGREHKFPVTLRIKRLLLTDRVSGNSRIYKTDLTLEFLRKDGNTLTQLLELSTWIEQGASKNAQGIQEKNITEILSKMFDQFDDVIQKQSNDPLFASKIVFRITGNKPVIQETDTIYWSKERKLTWKDFKGDPTSNYYAAQSNCAFAQSIEPQTEGNAGVIYIYVRAALLKKGSWVRKDQASDEVLRHEQLHFDIAEWQVRKLRKSLNEADLSLDNYEETVSKISNAAWDEYNRMQAAYDTETKHGTIEAEQVKWNKMVADGLVEFESYE
jgi:hypothetical protein